MRVRTSSSRSRATKRKPRHRLTLRPPPLRLDSAPVQHGVEWAGSDPGRARLVQRDRRDPDAAGYHLAPLGDLEAAVARRFPHLRGALETFEDHITADDVIAWLQRALHRATDEARRRRRLAPDDRRPFRLLVPLRWRHHYTALVVPDVLGQPEVAELFDAHRHGRLGYAEPPWDAVRAVFPRAAPAVVPFPLPFQQRGDTYCAVWTAWYLAGHCTPDRLRRKPTLRGTLLPFFVDEAQRWVLE